MASAVCLRQVLRRFDYIKEKVVIGLKGYLFWEVGNFGECALLYNISLFSVGTSIYR